MKSFDKTTADTTIIDAIREDPKVLRHVPKERQTEEMCYEAVLLDPHALRYAKCQTPKVCETAVQLNGLAIRHLKDPDAVVCAYAVSRNPSAWGLISASRATWVELAGIVPETLSRMPKEYLDEDASFYAVCRNAEAFRHVPDEFKSKEMVDLVWKKAKQQDPETAIEVFKAIPDGRKDQRMCLEAVKIAPMAMEFIPGDLQTPRICRVAVNGNPDAADFVANPRYLESGQNADQTSPRL